MIKTVTTGFVLLFAAGIFAHAGEQKPAPSPANAGSVFPTSTRADIRPSLGVYAQAKETCFLKGEKTDGMNKTCFYNCLSGEAAITIKSTSLCPLNIQR